jgi:non-specific serine/threonine protein kinase
LTSQNAEAIVHICRRLDGMPLAIEIAVARTTVLTPREIAARLDDQFRVLVGGNRAVPRQETLWAAVDWSYALLSPAEQAVLRRFAVFAGGASLQAAEAVCADDGLLASSVLDVLSQLANKSLVVVDVQHEVSRYRLLETTRQYALQRLQAAGEASAVFRRHADWCMWLAEEAFAHQGGPDLPVWLERLETEHDNFRAALAWQASDADAASRRARLTWALWYFWYLRGHWSEARRWVHAALDERDRLPRSILLLLISLIVYGRFAPW